MERMSVNRDPVVAVPTQRNRKRPLDYSDRDAMKLIWQQDAEKAKIKYTKSDYELNTETLKAVSE